MGKSARVESVEALSMFRRALWKYAESANVAISDADSDVGRTLGWLEREQIQHWQNQIRKRTELLGRAKEALRQKQIYRDASGRLPPADEEKKEVARATRAIEEAQSKFVATQRAIRKLQKEQMMYKGQIQRLTTLVNSDVPAAVAKLDNLTLALQAYIGFGPTTAGSTSGGSEPTSGMARGSTDERVSVDDSSSVDWASIRLRVPGASRRQAAVEADPQLLETILIPDDASGASLLGQSREILEDALRVTISPSAAGAPAVAWVRNEPYSSTDSGWHLVSTFGDEDEKTGIVAVTIAQASARSSVIAGILSLPVGTGCLIAREASDSEASIVSLVDSGNNPISRMLEKVAVVELESEENDSDTQP